MFLFGAILRVCLNVTRFLETKGVIQGDTEAHQAIQASCGAEAQLGSLAYVDKIYSDPCWAISQRRAKPTKEMLREFNITCVATVLVCAATALIWEGTSSHS